MATNDDEKKLLIKIVKPNINLNKKKITTKHNSISINTKPKNNDGCLI